MQTYKPGSVSRLVGTLIIYLAPALLRGSINLPIPLPPEGNHGRATHVSQQAENETYLVFHHARFTMPLMSPSER